jgi:hypothetical protein
MTEEPQPKIIIDEDWKSQVQAEKEAASKAQETQERAPQGSGSADEQAAGEPLPPASFGFLISTLATQATMALGHIPDPMEGKTVVRLPHAKHYIDILEMLEEKTKGNLADDEKRMLAGLLHELRMAYVQAMAAPVTPQPEQPKSPDLSGG